MDPSFKEVKRVPADWLLQRLETVKPLKTETLELYEVAKDTLTGEHYLHYAYLHRQVAAIGPDSSGEETFHHLLPLTSDDVLGVILGEQSYTYPEAWNHSFLRNGPDGDYVWFDPSYTDDEEQNERIGQSIKDRLVRFKQSKELTPEAVQKLLDELDRTDPADNS